jgi:hypothetical protein
MSKKQAIKSKKSSRLDALHRRVFDLNNDVSKLFSSITHNSRDIDRLKNLIIFSMIVCVCAAAISVVLLFTHTHDVEYNYCVEWGNFISREDLFVNCFDFTDNGMECMWDITNEQQLKITRFEDNKIFLYDCTKYISSAGVDDGYEKDN